MLQKGATTVNATTCQEKIAVLEEEFAAIYQKFPGLEEIYPRAKVSRVSVQNLKSAEVSFPLGIPGVIVLPGSTTRAGERIKGERLVVDDKGMVDRQIGLGESLTKKYGLLEAIRRFSPYSYTAYAVLIQGRNLTVFYNSI